MTIIVNIGRRIPRKWFERQASKIKGLISFQENIWQIIKQSMNQAKKKANASGKCTYTISYDEEPEDLNYKLQWMKIVIQSSKEIEEDEFFQAQRLYEPLNQVFKKDLEPSEDMKKHFMSKVLSQDKVQEAYEKGYGSIGEDNISNKLLEIGILTHIEKLDDFDSRESFFPT